MKKLETFVDVVGVFPSLKFKFISENKWMIWEEWWVVFSRYLSKQCQDLVCDKLVTIKKFGIFELLV